MELLLFYAFVSIFFSFLCSILEAVLLSVTPTFINVKKKEGKHYAVTLEELKKDVDQPLIAILTLNTIAHTVGAIMVGVQAKVAYQEIYGSTTRSIFGITYTEEVMVGVVSTIMTILILVLSEIIPKTIGATYWKKLANLTAKSLKIMVLALKWTGLLWVLQLFTRLIGKKEVHGSVLSRAKETTSIKEFFENNPKLRFSRIPIYGESVDIITGYVLKDNVLESIINENGDIPLSEIKRDLLVTKRNTPIPQLFETLIAKREHVALVVDEYGSVSGLVSMEDVIETLLGLEIMDESDNVEDLQLLARKKWEDRAKKTGIIE